MTEGLDLEVYKDIPGYKGILKAVLKSQIQLMVQQLAQHTGEESILLSASVSDGTFSHIGSDFGKDFIRGHDEFKAKFLGFCLEKYHKRKREERPPPAKRFASSSQMHRSKGHLGEAMSKTSPLSLSSGRAPGFVPTPKQMAYISPEELQAGDGHGKRERTLEQPRKVPRDSSQTSTQSGLPCTERDQGDNQKVVTIKVEVDTEEDRENVAEAVSGEETEANMMQPAVEERRKVVAEQSQPTANDGYTRVMESSYDYVLDHDRETETSPLPWQPNGAFSNERQSSSKRKQSVPVRHRPGVNEEESGFREDDSDIGLMDSLNEKYKSSNARNSPTLGSDISKSAVRSDEDVGYGFGEMSGLAWPGSSYSDMDSSKYATPSGDSDGSGSKNQYPKTPQIDGLLVSRGEGRFEKLIKCEICGKVCRTSNMARHKKRYCLGYQKGSGSPNSYSPVGARGERSLASNYAPMEPYTQMDPYTQVEPYTQMETNLDLDDIGSSGSS